MVAVIINDYNHCCAIYFLHQVVKLRLIKIFLLALCSACDLDLPPAERYTFTDTAYRQTDRHTDIPYRDSLHTDREITSANVTVPAARQNY